jgi:hypothetical protein
MTKLKEYSKVRIRKLTQNIDDYDGWNLNKRRPKIGEIGTLIDIIHADGLPDKYVVEKCDSEGIPIWLSDFYEEELEDVDHNLRI